MLKGYAMKPLKYSLVLLISLMAVIYTAKYRSDLVAVSHQVHITSFPHHLDPRRELKRKCTSPVSNFVFIKTHKTGSSSVLGLLRNYVNTNELNVTRAYQYPRPFVGGYPGRFKCDFMLPNKSTTTSLEHLRFDAEELKRCFAPNTRYFTILRQPWNSFQSGFHYYRKEFEQKDHCPGMPISYIMQGQDLNVMEFLLQASKMLNPTIPWYFRFRNYQSHDLGIDPMLNDKNEIDNKIQELDKNLDLVMLMEYFDESLVLLKDLLCLDWKSLQHVYHYKEGLYDRNSDFPTRKHKKAFEHLHKIDIALYEHFNQTLWKRVNAYGRDRMTRDLQTLHRMRNENQDTVEKREQRGPVPATTSQWRKQLKQYMSENSGACFKPEKRTSGNALESSTQTSITFH